MDRSFSRLAVGQLVTPVGTVQQALFRVTDLDYVYQVVGPVGYTYPGLKIFYRVVQSVNQTFFILEICS